MVNNMSANSSKQPESSVLDTDLLILAGGQSTRMGCDKAMLEVQGCTLLEHHINNLSTYVNDIFVSGDDERPVDLSAKTVQLSDYLPGYQGPLSGLYAGFNASGATYLWVLPCDSYGVAAGLFEMMRHCLEESGADIACCEVDGRIQPLLAVVKRDALATLGEYLKGGGRAVMPWMKSSGFVSVKVPEQMSIECNINTQEQYQYLLNKGG